MPVTQNWINIISSYRIFIDIVSNSDFWFQWSADNE